MNISYSRVDDTNIAVYDGSALIAIVSSRRGGLYKGCCPNFSGMSQFELALAIRPLLPKVWLLLFEVRV